MEEEKKKAYSEVVEILKLIEDEEKMEKIPFEVIELIKRNADSTYKPQISTDKPLEDQNLREQTYAILGWIASKYWGEEFVSATESQEGEPTVSETKNIEEDKAVETISNEKSEEIPYARNCAVYNDIDPEILEAEVPEQQNNLPILLSSLKWYQKIKIQVIKFFKIIFKVNKKNVEGASE